MSDAPIPASNGKWLLLGAFALLVFCGVMAWRQAHAPVVPDKDSGHETTKGGGETSPPLTSPSSNGERPQTVHSNEEKDERQIESWLSDEKISKEDAARNLWKFAADLNRSETVRKEALDNALILAEDPQFRRDFIPTLSEKGVWTGELADALVADILNRSAPVKLEAAAALLPEATGDQKESLRDLLQFQLDSESEDDDTLIQLAKQKAAAEPDESTGGE